MKTQDPFPDSASAHLEILNLQILELQNTISNQNELLKAQAETIKNFENGFNTAKLAWWILELPEGNVSFHPLKATMLGYDKSHFQTYHDFVKLLHPDDLGKTMAAMHDLLSGKSQTYDAEYRILCSTGDYKWYRDSGIRRHGNPDGGKTTIWGYVQDISLLKTVEQESVMVKNQFDATFNAMEEKVYLKDASLRYIYANKAFLNFIGKNADDIIGKMDFDVLPEADAETCFKSDLETLETNKLSIFESQINSRTLESHKFPVLIKENETGLGCFIVDITAKKLAEQQMQYFATMMEQNDSIVVVKDLDLKVVATNSAFARAAGLASVNELLGKTDAEIFNVSPDTEPVRSYMNDELMAQKLPRGEFLIREEPITLSNGETRTLFTKKYPIYSENGGLIATGNISTDITRLKKDAVELMTARLLAEKNQNRFENVAQYVGEFIFEVDANGTFLYANKSVQDILGFKPEDIIGKKSCFDLLLPELRDEKMEIITNHFRQHQSLENLDCVLITKKKKQVNVVVNGIPIVTKKGELQGYQGSMRDVTEHIKYQAKLSENESKYRQLVENLNDVLFTLNENGIIEYISPSIVQLTGIQAEEYIGKSFEEFIMFDHEWELLSQLENVKNGELEVGSFMIRTNHEFDVWVRSSVKQLKNDEDEFYYLGIIHDITSKRDADQAIKDSELKFSSAFYSSPYPMLITDTIMGKIMEANNAFYLKTGYGSEDIANNPYFERSLWKNPEDRDEFAEMLDNGKQVIEREYVFIAKGNRQIIGLISAQPIMVKNEMMILATINDITEKKLFEASMHRQNELLMAVSDASQILLSEKNIHVAMPKVLELMGKASEMDRIYLFKHHVDQSTGENLMSQHFEWVKDGVSVQINNALLQNLSFDNMFPRWLESFINGESISGEVASFPLTEQAILVPQDIKSLLVVPVVADGELWGFLGFDDCTGTLPWSQGEHAILNTLASSLGAALSRNKNEESLRIAKNKAEESDRLKTKFLQNISHEIRTPMNAISGFVGFMKDPEVDSDEKEVFMDIIEKSVQQLLSTINNIVEISIIDAGLQSPSQLDFGIADMMNQIIDEHEKQAHRKHIDLKINYRLPETIQSIITDPKYLQSILYNLTDNAIKYTKSGGVELGVYLHDNDIVFYVQDTGIGIAENQLDIIFQRFEHGEGHKEKAREGSGLGLAVAKAYVQALGGKIWVQSELGVGSTFYVKIPFVTLSKAIGKTPWPEHEEPLIIPEKTILIVEDQIINYYVLELMLRENKCKVLLAKSGEEAVSITKSNDNISLILMDVKMGGIDGYQATRLIRQFNTTVPIIAQTAHVYTQDKEKAINSGCDDFIAKPIHRGILQRMLRRYLI